MPDCKRDCVSKRLLGAAVKVFGARGYTASRVSVSDIVAGAGVAQGTFYLYFKNKEAIFLQLVDDFFGRLLGETLGRYPASELNSAHELAEQLARMWRTILKRCRQEPVLTTLVLREAYVLGPASRAQIDERFNHVAAAIGAYLEQASQREIIDLDMTAPVAWALLGILERAIHYALVVDPEADVETLAKVFLRVELGGLLGAPDLFAQSEQGKNR